MGNLLRKSREITDSARRCRRQPPQLDNAPPFRSPRLPADRVNKEIPHFFEDGARRGDEPQLGLAAQCPELTDDAPAAEAELLYAALPVLRAPVVPNPTRARLTVLLNPSAVTECSSPRAYSRGGIRLPQLEVPTARHAGIDPAGRLQMFGTSTPLSTEVLSGLYPSPLEWRLKRAQAAKAAVASGALLKIDADEIAR
ncbi:MAG: hypothetical protein JWM91_4579, partial [Rhodospirillales bacterium]|nr:hypothetical protein [Rhodospirillales bacterium]